MTTTGQFKDIAAILIGAVPDLSFDEAQAAIGDKSSLVAGVREVFLRWKNSEPSSTDAPAPATPTALPVPEEHVPFSLPVDNDQDPMDVVSSAGYEKKGWKYLGPKRSGKQVYDNVRLVRLGYVRSLDEAKQAADKLGFRLLEGQARESFKAKYPAPDGKGPVIFGGSEWRYPDGYALVTGLYRRGDVWRSLFHYSGIGFGGRCRWVVVSK